MSPVSRSALFSCRRVTPASTVDVEVLGADPHDAIHFAQIDGDPAAERLDVPLEGCSGAERDEGQLEAPADLDTRDHFLGIAGKHTTSGAAGG